MQSPRITHLEWGVIEAEGIGRTRDLKLWPGGGRPWDWGETDTHHVPGIQIADVEELLEHRARVVVLTRGMDLVLRTCPETLAHLEARGVRVHVAETREAVRAYNELVAQAEAVGGLFHSTR